MKFSYTLAAGAVLVVAAVATYIYIPGQQKDIPVEDAPIETVVVEPREPIIFYGIIVDSLKIVRNSIRKNQNLSDLLTPYNVPKEAIYALSVSSKGVFNIRKMGANKPYDIIHYNDSLKTAKAMVYYHNDIDYVIFHLDDSVYVEKGAKEVITREQTATGIIQNSLAVTMDEMGLSPLLTNEIADVFAWEIDFFRLYPGDRFKVIYEEQLVGDKQIGISAIKAAVFEHNGYKSYAYFYDQGTSADFFNDQGKSLRKAFLKYPVQFSRISSRYSGRRYHPVQKRYKAHRGTDFAAPRGTPIRSVGEGVVVEARYSVYNGNYVKIRHNSIYTTQYLHMSKIANGMKYGTHVKQGQTIGYVGATGLAKGNHVCYRFWKSGYQVDALKVKLPSSDPVKKELLEDFNTVAANFKVQLDALVYPATAIEEKNTASIGGSN